MRSAQTPERSTWACAGMAVRRKAKAGRAKSALTWGMVLICRVVSKISWRAAFPYACFGVERDNSLRHERSFERVGHTSTVARGRMDDLEAVMRLPSGAGPLF